MKNLFTVLVAIGMGGAVSLLNAHQFEITPTLSKKVSDDDGNVKDDNVYYGIRGDIFIDEKRGVQVGFETSQDNVMSDTGKTDKERYTINALYQPFGKSSAKAWKPYFVAGGGYEKIHREIPGASSQGFVDLGVGVKVRVNPRVDLVSEARIVHGLEDKDDDLMGIIGLGVKLGALKEGCKTAVVVPKQPVSEVEMAKLCKPRQWQEPVKVAQPKPLVVDEKVAAVAPEKVKVKECPVVPEAAKGVYVQVIALQKYSADPIVKRLRRAHIPFTLKADRGLTKVLAGPYANRQSAARALRKIRRIRRDAFITTIE